MADTSNTTRPMAQADAAGLACMEIWGGSQARRSAVSAQGVDFWVQSLPYRNVDAGGDIHYISVCGSGRFIRSALADVSGHGANVAALAKTLRNLMRRHINTPDQTRFARALNEELGDLQLEGKFATAILATYHTPSESLILCNAGHPTPLHRPRGEPGWKLLEREDEPEAPHRSLRNLPLGVIPGTTYEQRVLPLAEGDMLVLYTDAIIEARDAQGQQLGERGLEALINTLDIGDEASPDALIDALLNAVRERQQTQDFDDDVTLVLLRANGTKPKLSMSDHFSTVAKLLGLKKV